MKITANWLSWLFGLVVLSGTSAAWGGPLPDKDHGDEHEKKAKEKKHKVKKAKDPQQKKPKDQQHKKAAQHKKAKSP
jgi:hypothetical protein